MNYTAYAEEKIYRYNGKVTILPWLMPPYLARLILFVPLWFIGINPLYLIVFAALSQYKFMVVLLFLSYVPFNVAIWVFFGKLLKSGQEYSIKAALFAQRNNFTFELSSGQLHSKSTLLGVLKSPKFSNIVTGIFEDAPFSLFTTYGNGLYIVLKIQLQNKYPHIVLDSTDNNFLFSNLRQKLPSEKEIVLEGNFPDYFKVFSAGSSVETLQILTPELMGRMIDYPKKADIEIVEDQLHLILNYKTLTEQDIRMLFESVKQILIDIGAASNNSKTTFDVSEKL